MTSPVYSLPQLTYDYDALEPHISATVMQLHHGKHHAAYVKGANDALAALAAARDTDDWSSITQLEKNLAFNLGGHVLHNVLWTSMAPAGQQVPSGDLAAEIDRTFGSLDRLRSHLDKACTTLQGSGWAALSWEPIAGRLVVQQVYDHQGNVGLGTTPLFVIDGWEHAYYLDHFNDKAAWVESFWKVADWASATARFAELSAA